MKEVKFEETIDEYVEVKGEFKSGFTWKSLVALTYSLLVFSPAAIYLRLVTIGGSLGSAVEYSTLLLFSEVSAMVGGPITPQEAAIIFGPATLRATEELELIYRIFLVRSPLLSLFGVDPSEIPLWYSPSYTSPVWDQRTLFHPDWILPIAVRAMVHIVSLASGLFFGLLARELFIETERLPFPMQQITVSAIVTLSERRTDRIRILSIGGFAGLVYGLIYYVIPFVTGLDLIPKPWIDLTGAVERFLPGASFGIATSLTGITVGVIIPQEMLVIGIFLGSIARFMAVNPLLISLGLSSWSEIWIPGMNLTRIYQFSQLHFWLNPIIGIGLAVGLVPLFFKGNDLIRFLRSFASGSKRKRFVRQERISGASVRNEWLIVLFSIGILGTIILELSLLPDFPLWVLLLYEFVMPLLITLSAGRMFALTGSTRGSLSIPYFQQITLIASNYPKISGWFLPLRVDPGTGWLRSFKICQLTKTTLGSWIKVAVIGWLVSLTVGLLYVQVFWQISPIPSGIYPTPGIQWPIDIMNTLVWITRPKQFFDPSTILTWGLAFGVLTSVLCYFNMPYIAFGIASGISTPIPTALLIFVGLILKKILIRFFGRTWVLRYRAPLLAGLALGEGLTAIIGISVAMLMKGAWSVAY